MAKTKQPDIIRTYRREVPTKLTRDEVHDYGKKLASKQRERDAIDAKRKTVAKQYAGELSTADEEIRRLTAAIDSGEELRSSEVYDVLEGSQVITYLKATGEMVDQRPAGFADSQMDAFPDLEQDEPEPKPEPAPKKGRGKAK